MYSIEICIFHCYLTFDIRYEILPELNPAKVIETESTVETAMQMYATANLVNVVFVFSSNGTGRKI